MHLIIIGGGAAGLCAAITAKRQNPKLNLTVLESNDRVCKKLITTGNGRCNITNKDLHILHYHGGTELCSVLDNDFIIQFFDSIGTEIVFEESGRGYPASYQALSVVDNLRFACEKLGIEICTGQRVTDISANKGCFTVTAAQTFSADAVLLACGSPAGGKIASDSGYALLKRFGHKVLPVTPAIVPIQTEVSVPRQLKGIKVNASATLYIGGKAVCKEYGEVLFCDYGLSGPPILQLARAAAFGKPNTYIELDLMPALSAEAVLQKLTRRAAVLHDRVAGEFFTGLLNKRLGQVICKVCNCNLQMPARQLPLEQLTSVIKALHLPVTGVLPLSQAQVAAGGADTAEFGSDFMSKKQAGLFCAGEVLNVDGDCGGFNLAFAWCSGAAAATAAVQWLEENRNFA
ncbi:MAG: aminoacetone oxidase family FAD-binding enzyme [Clostridia bacterium]|nr:aminoacetone oxidase family FAD-binding enzyme [Clostridia bacterium]MBQ7289159.1 aminoacetone oxidase family FAD-binding enzyme [Clostridia bacterium]